MGEYVEARLIRPGDYINAFGPGFMVYKVQDITGDHSRQKTGDGPWQDKRILTILTGNFRHQESRQGFSGPADHKVYRRWARPTVNVNDEDTVIVNGVPVGRIVLQSDETAFEYMVQSGKREIIGGPNGYVWHSLDMEGEFLGKAISYEECLDNMVQCALMDMEKN